MRDKAQSKRFISAACEANCNDDLRAFERIFADTVMPRTGKLSPQQAGKGETK